MNDYEPMNTPPIIIKKDLSQGKIPHQRVGLRKRRGNYVKPGGEHEVKPTGKIDPNSSEESNLDEFVHKRLILNNDRHEYYCKLRAEGQTKTAAYRMAYPESNSPGQSARMLEQREDIKVRIAQLMEERAVMSKLVDPQESLARWNTIFLEAHERGDVKTMIKAQENIDVINGAKEVSSVMKNQLQGKGLFRGEDDSEWKKMAEQLASILITTKKKGSS